MGVMPLARRRSRAVLSLALVLVLPPRPSAPADAQRWMADVRYLASDALAGRETGSPGHRKAAEYVAGRFRRAGLVPAGARAGSYFQPVRLRSRRIVEARSSLAVVRDGQRQPLVLGDDATLGLRGDPAPSLTAEMVFVGYGLHVPEQGHDDLAGQDLAGKLAVYVSGGPASLPGPLLAHSQSAAQRWSALRAAGAVGVVSIQNPRGRDVPWERSRLARLEPSMGFEDPALDDARGMRLSVTVNPDRAEALFTSSGRTFQEVLALALKGEPLPRFPLRAALHAEVAFEAAAVVSDNVAGLLPGTDPALKDEVVVLSAHLDHLGLGAPIDGDRVYNGALDNASGIATLLDVAASLHGARKAFRRPVLFLAVTGEEKGLLGSRYYAVHPTVAPRGIVANVNTDMLLPLFPLKRLIVLGLDESDLGEAVRALAAPLGLEVLADPEPERNAFTRSDQYSFIRRGVPAVSLKIGYLKDSPEAQAAREWRTRHYHAPSDEADQPLDLDAVAVYDDVLARLTEAVANAPARPRWKPESFFSRFAPAP
jgi:hypothetical protein